MKQKELQHADNVVPVILEQLAAGFFRKVVFDSFSGP